MCIRDRRVNPAGPRNGARITKECWSTPQALGRERESPRRSGGPASTRPKPESPGGTGENRGPSDPSGSCPGVLVDPVGPRNRARVARESWWTPCALGEECESPGRAGRLRGLKEPGASRPGELVDPAGPRNRAREGWTAGQPRGPSDPGPSRTGLMVDLAGLWT